MNLVKGLNYCYLL